MEINNTQIKKINEIPEIDDNISDKLRDLASSNKTYYDVLHELAKREKVSLASMLEAYRKTKDDEPRFGSFYMLKNVREKLKGFGVIKDKKDKMDRRNLILFLNNDLLDAESLSYILRGIERPGSPLNDHRLDSGPQSTFPIKFKTWNEFPKCTLNNLGLVPRMEVTIVLGGNETRSDGSSASAADGIWLPELTKTLIRWGLETQNLTLDNINITTVFANELMEDWPFKDRKLNKYSLKINFSNLFESTLILIGSPKVNCFVEKFVKFYYKWLPVRFLTKRSKIIYSELSGKAYKGNEKGFGEENTGLLGFFNNVYASNNYFGHGIIWAGGITSFGTQISLLALISHIKNQYQSKTKFARKLEENKYSKKCSMKIVSDLSWDSPNNPKYTDYKDSWMKLEGKPWRYTDFKIIE